MKQLVLLALGPSSLHGVSPHQGKDHPGADSLFPIPSPDIAALQVIAHARRRIRTIDGYKLLALLQSREREIRLALHDIESER